MANSNVPSYQSFATQVPLDRFAGEREFKAPTRFEQSASFSKPQLLVPATVAAAGSTVADAALVPAAPVVSVTAANGTKGVVLPASPAGTAIDLYNVAAGALVLYPPTDGDFNDGTKDEAISLAAKSAARLVCIDGTTWSAIYTAST